MTTDSSISLMKSNWKGCRRKQS